MVACLATLIARPETAADLRRIAEGAARATGGRLDWLAEDEAVDLLAEGAPEELKSRLAGLIRGAPVDCVVQPPATRRKRLLVADMDSTMIDQECIDELADMVGLKPRIAAITERAMRGEIEFEPALRERVGLLAGLPLAVVDQVIAERIRLASGAVTLIATMRQAGAYTALVSGGFTLFTERVAKAIGFHENRANTLITEAGALVGKVAEPILGQDAKLATLRELRDKLGLTAIDTMAVGDGANDLAMIRDAGLGVALHAKPKVAEAAAARIDHADLTALLYIQGFRKSEFVTAPDTAI